MLTGNEMRQIRADLILTALQSVQYVADGKVFALDAATRYHISHDDAKSYV